MGEPLQIGKLVRKINILNWYKQMCQFIHKQTQDNIDTKQVYIKFW